MHLQGRNALFVYNLFVLLYIPSSLIYTTIVYLWVKIFKNITCTLSPFQGLSSGSAPFRRTTFSTPPSSFGVISIRVPSGMMVGRQSSHLNTCKIVMMAVEIIHTTYPLGPKTEVKIKIKTK